MNSHATKEYVPLQQHTMIRFLQMLLAAPHDFETHIRWYGRIRMFSY